jgi:hypothetical protein
MKTLFILLSLSLSLPLALAQERLERKDALKHAFLVSVNLKKLQGTPISTDVDLKQPVALRDGQYGAMILPESKLSADILAKAGQTPLPVGQLWFHRLTPLVEGQPVPAEKLRLIEVPVESDTSTAVQCALGVKAGGDGQLDLLVFGKDTTPILRLPLKKTQVTQEAPIEMTAERTGDQVGRLTLNLLGRYEAVIPVTELVP